MKITHQLNKVNNLTSIFRTQDHHCMQLHNLGEWNINQKLLINITLQTQPFIISIALRVPSEYIHLYNHLASLNFHNINVNHLQSGIIYMTCIESKHVIKNIRNFFINNFYFKIFPTILLHVSDFGIRLLKYKTCHHASLLLKTCILCLEYALEYSEVFYMQNKTSSQRMKQADKYEKFQKR